MRCLVLIVTLLFYSFPLLAQPDSISKLESRLEAKKDTARVNVLNELTRAFLTTDLDKAENYAQDALALSEKLNYLEGEIKSRGYLGYVFQRKGYYSKSSDYLKKAIQIAGKIDDKNLLAKANSSMFGLLYTLGQYDSAAIYVQRSLDIATEINNIQLIARGNGSLGILNGIKGNHSLAVEHFLKAMKGYEILGDEAMTAFEMGRIGHTLELAGNYDEALKYLLATYELQHKMNDRNSVGWTLLNIGVTYSRMNQDSLRLVYYNKSLIIAEEITDQRLMIACLENIGGWYTNQGDFINAGQYLQKAYTISEKSGYNSRTVYITGNLAENHYLTGDMEKAEEFGLKHLEYAQKDKEISEQKVAYDLLSKIYRSKKEFKNAHNALSEYIKINDSIFNQQKSNQIERLRTEFETEKKEQEILTLEQQKQNADFKRNSYLVGSVFIIGLLSLLYNQQRLRSKKNKLLFEKEQEIAKMKSNFFANVSHEFRTPLTLILGPIQILKSGIKSTKLNYHLNAMERNANRLLSLINQLLDMSKLESGKSILELTKSDIVLVAKGIVMSFHSKAAAEEIELMVESDFDHLQAYFDREKVETILINLLTNSFNFTPKKGEIKVSLEVIEDAQHIKKCKIVVRDNGRGIPNEDIDTVFNRFYQSTNQQDGQYDGSGIGLALTKELVELHKGSIGASSKEGEGTAITVMLPLGKAHFSKEEFANVVEKEVSRVRDVLDIASEQLDHISSHVLEDSLPILLLIEDNSDVMRYIKEILGDTYQILEAIDGEIGIEIATENIPDMIISDVMMPKKNGYEVCETLKQDERTSHIPIILLTAKASLDDKMQGLSTKADAYLTKPFVPKELLIRVQNLIDSRKQLREKYNRELILKPNEISVSSIDETFLKKVMKIVDENLDDEHFNMDKLGQGVGMSRSQIHRKLQALTNQSATQFIRSYRLDRAMDLIKKNAGSISEIAYSVGFSDPSYFSKCFQQQFNSTPTEAKEKNS